MFCKKGVLKNFANVTGKTYFEEHCKQLVLKGRKTVEKVLYTSLQQEHKNKTVS